MDHGYVSLVFVCQLKKDGSCTTYQTLRGGRKFSRWQRLEGVPGHLLCGEQSGLEIRIHTDPQTVASSLGSWSGS